MVQPAFTGMRHAAITSSSVGATVATELSSAVEFSIQSFSVQFQVLQFCIWMEEACSA